jgi:hypothetical protein
MLHAIIIHEVCPHRSKSKLLHKPVHNPVVSRFSVILNETRHLSNLIQLHSLNDVAENVLLATERRTALVVLQSHTSAEPLIGIILVNEFLEIFIRDLRLHLLTNERLELGSSHKDSVNEEQSGGCHVYLR